MRLELGGEAEAIEIDYRTETDDFGFRGPGAGAGFALFRGERLVCEAPARLGEGSVRLAAGRGPRGEVVGQALQEYLALSNQFARIWQARSEGLRRSAQHESEIAHDTAGRQEKD